MRTTDTLLILKPRRERLFQINQRWFFKTREDGHYGPYFSQQEALQGIDVYLALIHLNDEVNALRRTA